ncbi:helix-turn-helix transcriptional regulator [Aureimonas jatrophae]|uniref:Predicted DNA-binding transcriptional regulator YafY, contains an HTH and WYL domains n=1 Tax=Aureimonas jatrophae TaxID=1166073 RepID=A0A1H0N906_9HYPH|nr:YafY family protein [Aureimonas jatrophae]MBB3951605.1 putative DNA-binding transcriptional regulator YafY [Aureimonas jatrophae]SDO88810.1 Predicted DNA-binding transcriptional regulator YafY, contains an HTH and WYL domains [Aureimonas jatrophae]
MARSDRLFRLLHAMRTMSAPITAARLAEATEVSQRSLYRDIDALRAAGARIEGERGYGYRLIEDYALPPQTFERPEIEAIALGMAEVASLGDPVLAEAAASVLAKVAATLPDDREQYLLHAISQVFRPTPRYGATPHMETVRGACWREEALEIGYVDQNGAVSTRSILPLAVVYTDRTQTVLAWCCLREDFRMFRADRLRTVSLAESSFRPRRAPLLRRYLAELKARAASAAEPRQGAEGKG